MKPNEINDSIIVSDPFKDYKRTSDSTKRVRSYVWHTADWHVFED